MNYSKIPARTPDITATDLMIRAMDGFGDGADRVVVIVLNDDGMTMRLFSNARSEAEMQGMIHCGLDWIQVVGEDE